MENITVSGIMSLIHFELILKYFAYIFGMHAIGTLKIQAYRVV